LDKCFSTKYMQFVALGNILVYTFTLHTNDNDKEEYSTKQFRRAHLTISVTRTSWNWTCKIHNKLCRNHILSYTETRLRYWLLGNIFRQLELYQFFYGQKFDRIGEVLDMHILDFSTVSYQIKIPILHYSHSNYIRRRHLKFLFWGKMRMVGSHVGLHFWPWRVF
jgi:hypothetical protein